MRRNRFALLALAVSLAAGGGIALLPVDAAVAKTAASAKVSADGEALATLVAVNQHEIETAKQALAKGVQGSVRAFAEKMVAEHSKNLSDTRDVARDSKTHLAETAAVKALKKKTLGERQSLQKLSGDAYSKAYVEAMVKGHQDVLDKLDNQLIPQAKDAQVIAHLKATREHVAEHLAAAKAL
jgi:putative membrane protein